MNKKKQTKGHGLLEMEKNQHYSVIVSQYSIITLDQIKYWVEHI